MPLPISRSALDRLGQRLAAADEISDEDYLLLERVLNSYDEAMGRVQSRLTALGLDATTRLKTTPTLIDKLRREHGIALKGVQEVAGARTVVGPTRREQDEVVASIVADFARDPKPPTVKDRREFPSFGYRAVHVIVSDDGLPVEVQVRTELQDLWAQAIERLGDRWGRGIRYGEEPSDPDGPALGGAAEITRRDLLATMQRVSSNIDEIEQSRLMLMDAEDALAYLDQHDEDDQEVLALKTDARDAKERLEAVQTNIATTLRNLVRYLEKGAGA